MTVPLAIIALLGWATWPPRENIVLGWYGLLVAGAVAVVFSVVGDRGARRRHRALPRALPRRTQRRSGQG